MKVKGIVIKSLDYKESSKIVYLFTKHGVISIKALGAKKLRKGLIGFTTTLNLVEAEITSGSLPTLIDYTLLDAYEDLKQDLKITLWVNYLLELTYKLPADVSHERCFDFLLRILEHMREKKDVFLLVIMYQLKLTILFGVAPLFKPKSPNTHFSLKEGRYVHSGESINDNDAKELEKMYYFDDKTGDFADFDKTDLHQIFNLVSQYYLYHVNINIKGLNSVIF